MYLTIDVAVLMVLFTLDFVIAYLIGFGHGSIVWAKEKRDKEKGNDEELDNE